MTSWLASDVALMERACAVRDLRPVGIRAARPGVLTFEARRGRRPVIMKLSAQRMAQACEVAVLSLLANLGRLVPPLLETGVVEDRAYSLQGRMPGRKFETLASLPPDQRWAASRSIGMALASIQGASDQSRLLASSYWRRGADPRDEFEGWRTYLGRQLIKWRSRVLFDEADIAAGLPSAVTGLFQLFAEADLPDRSDLIHGDYTTRNLLFNRRGAEVSAVIDYEAAMIGDGLYDLGKTIWLDMTLEDNGPRRCLLEGWEHVSGRPASLTLLALYAGAQCLAAIAWCDTRPDAPDAAQFRHRAAGALTTLARRAWHL